MSSEIDLQRLIDASPVTHFVAAASGDFDALYVSGAVLAQLGYTAEQFTQDSEFWLRLVDPDDRVRVLAELQAIFDNDRSVCEYRFLHAAGGWRCLRDQRVLIRDADGQPSRIVGSWLDMTEREQATRARREMADRLQEFQRIAGIGSWEVDTATGRQWWSDETYRILGEDAVGFALAPGTLLAKIHPDDRQRFVEAARRALTDGKPYSINYRIVRPDGEERIIHGRGHGVAPSAGPVTSFAGTVQDVTERERTEQALRNAEARNRALLEAHPDVIFRIDSEGRYLDLSVSPNTPFPFTREDVVGKHVTDLFDEDFAREHQRHARKAIATGEVQLWQRRMALPHGDVDLEARFVRSGEDEAVVTVRDVTERLAMQREIVAAQERERRRIGHDLHDGLGQELTGLSLALEVLAQKLAAEGSTHLQIVQNLKGMSQELISATRRIAVSLSPAFGYERALAEALESLASEVRTHSNVNCRAEYPSNVHRHDIEVETNLYRIAQEGVTNALKHGQARNVELRYSCDGKTIRLEVLDDGVGIVSESGGTEGMGLRSMQYRAQMIDGTFECGARAAGGTHLICACPCEHQHARDAAEAPARVALDRR